MQRTAIACLLAGLLALPAAADQDDPQLDGLFDRLQATDNATVARDVQGRIWAIWFEHQDPEVQALMNRGRAEMQVGHFDEALAAFDEVIERAPGYAEGWNRRATLYYLTGRYEASLADIEKVLELEPRHFGALSGRGLVLTELGRYEAAIEAFRAALEVNPHMDNARTNIEHLRGELEKREI